MTEKTFSVSPPYPRVEVLMPGNGGTLKGKVIGLVEKRPGEVWVQVCVPTWTHWRTQVEVGRPSKEGLAPGETTMWAPGYAVSGDSDDIDRLRGEYRATMQKC